MKVAIRCANCNRIVRRSNCYRVRLQDVYRNDSTMFEKPNWITVDEKVWLCKVCAIPAGYKVKHQEKYEKDKKLVK